LEWNHPWNDEENKNLLGPHQIGSASLNPSFGSSLAMIHPRNQYTIGHVSKVENIKKSISAFSFQIIIMIFA
jgi:hypothetical protein